MKFIYLDTETGGLYPAVHALLSIGAVGPGGECFREFILAASQPGKQVHPEAAAVNGYTPERWKQAGARALEDVMPRFCDWLEGLRRHYGEVALVVHNAVQDHGFLGEAARVTECWLPDWVRFRCTMVLLANLMDRSLIPPGSTSLDRLAELSAGEPVMRPAIHDALEDAQLVRQGHRWLTELQEAWQVNADVESYEEKVRQLEARMLELKQENDRLRGDIGVMNGRLLERTETMLERQKELLDRARRAEARVKRLDGERMALDAGIDRPEGLNDADLAWHLKRRNGREPEAPVDLELEEARAQVLQFVRPEQEGGAA